ncbi:hypothetical protein OFAG_00986 [Oxalobacter formigenes HOxBLS]|uniref:Uncharacterized protein n=1 Tax=Oxalobacter paraformigenes TaxID=556268 RepID=C3X3P7_9BURK|nr:hypothetical protein OFAG_00986 [Oxalobacter paraformigenes]
MTPDSSGEKPGKKRGKKTEKPALDRGKTPCPIAGKPPSNDSQRFLIRHVTEIPSGNPIQYIPKPDPLYIVPKTLFAPRVPLRQSNRTKRNGRRNRRKKSGASHQRNPPAIPQKRTPEHPRQAPLSPDLRHHTETGRATPGKRKHRPGKRALPGHALFQNRKTAPSAKRQPAIPQRQARQEKNGPATACHKPVAKYPAARLTSPPPACRVPAAGPSGTRRTAVSRKTRPGKTVLSLRPCGQETFPVTGARHRKRKNPNRPKQNRKPDPSGKRGKQENRPEWPVFPDRQTVYQAAIFPSNGLGPPENPQTGNPALAGPIATVSAVKSGYPPLA